MSERHAEYKQKMSFVYFIFVSNFSARERIIALYIKLYLVHSPVAMVDNKNKNKQLQQKREYSQIARLKYA